MTTLNWDAGQARRWLASGLDGVDALTDAGVGEGAQLLADVMDAGRFIAEAKKEAVIPAVEWSRRCSALWGDFCRRHPELTGKPRLRSPKDIHRRWLASSFDGTDALSDKLIANAAYFYGREVGAQQFLAHAEARKSVAVSIGRRDLEQWSARWRDFKRRHGLTSKPPKEILP